MLSAFVENIYTSEPYTLSFVIEPTTGVGNVLEGMALPGMWLTNILMIVDFPALVTPMNDTSCGKRFFMESVGNIEPIRVAYLP